MGTSTAFSASVSASAAAAAAAANSARRAECMILIDRYDTKTATVQDMQVYANCIDRIYPQYSSPAEIVIFKVLAISALLGIIGGGVMGWRTQEGPVFAGMMAFAGGFAAPLAVGFIILIFSVIFG